MLSKEFWDFWRFFYSKKHDTNETDGLIDWFATTHQFPSRQIGYYFRKLTKLRDDFNPPTTRREISYEELRTFANVMHDLSYTDKSLTQITKQIATKQLDALEKECNKNELEKLKATNKFVSEWILANNEMKQNTGFLNKLVSRQTTSVTHLAILRMTNGNASLRSENEISSDSRQTVMSKLIPLCASLGSRRSCAFKATIACASKFPRGENKKSVRPSSELCQLGYIYQVCRTIILGSDDERRKFGEQLVKAAQRTPTFINETQSFIDSAGQNVKNIFSKLAHRSNRRYNKFNKQS